MEQSNSSNYPLEPESQENEPHQPPLHEDVPVESYPSRRQPRWVSALGILLLLTGLGLGWRWWQGSRTAAPNAQMAGAGQPPGIPVKLATVQTTAVQEYSVFIGSLESQDSVVVRPEITGRVSQIFVSKGDRVTAGTPLVQLKQDEREAQLASVIASINSARAIRANAQSQIEALQADRIAQVAEVELQQESFRRISSLVEEGAFPQERLDQVARDRKAAAAQLSAIDRRIQAARANLAEAEAGLQQAQANANRATAQLGDATIVAPLEGIVGDMPVRVGAVVTNSDTLTTITRNQSLDLKLSIPLERSPDLRLGQRVDLVDAQGKVLQAGRMSFIAPSVDGGAQSILATATFDNPEGQLRDGQFVRARVTWQEGPGILVPTTAISRLAGETFIFVAESPEPTAQQGEAAPSLVARQRRVVLGSIQGNSYQVLEGLKPGEKVVVSGILNLSDKAPIMVGEPGGEMSGTS